VTATIDISADGAHDQDVPQPEATGGYGLPGQPAAGRPMVAIEVLTAHPGNVRRDIHLDQEFLDSIAELGILTPLRVTPAGRSFRVIEGHRRLAAAAGPGGRPRAGRGTSSAGGLRGRRAPPVAPRADGSGRGDAGRTAAVDPAPAGGRRGA